MFVDMIKRILNAKLTENEIIILVSVFVFTALLVSVFRRIKRNFPPGPYGLPFVGYLPFMTEMPHLKLIELSKKYGDIFSITLGSKTMVVLNNADLIREAYLKPEFLGRPPYGAFSLFKKGSPFFTSPIHVWQEQRKFVVHSMKDLGLGKSKIEEHIKDEIVATLEELESYKGRPINFFSLLNKGVTNNILGLVFGIRYPFKDSIWEFFTTNIGIVTRFFSQTSMYQIFPWLTSIPIINYPARVSLEAYENVSNYFLSSIKEHEKTLDPLNVRDYVDSYLIEMKSRKKNNPNTTFDETTLVDSSMDLFGAGRETVHTSLLWSVYILAAYPDIQKKIQKEILSVIGSERMADFMDQKSMPYLQAFILEVQRWVTIVPMNVLHYTVNDTTVGGYDIPRNMAVIANLWAVHHDPKYWTNPQSFKPERFLAEDGTTIVKPTTYMPFSIGKRSCPGETMAYMEIFLFLVSILQHFDVVFPKGYKPTFKPVVTLTQRPDDFEIQFINRT